MPRNQMQDERDSPRERALRKAGLCIRIATRVKENAGEDVSSEHGHRCVEGRALKLMDLSDDELGRMERDVFPVFQYPHLEPKSLGFKCLHCKDTGNLGFISTIRCPECTG